MRRGGGEGCGLHGSLSLIAPVNVTTIHMAQVLRTERDVWLNT